MHPNYCFGYLYHLTRAKGEVEWAECLFFPLEIVVEILASTVLVAGKVPEGCVGNGKVLLPFSLSATVSGFTF